MSFGLRWGEDNIEEAGFIYFDAVSVYTQNYKGTVTKHPVDTGGNITDHYIRDNPVFTLSAVITGVDISNQTYLIQDLDGNYPFNSNLAPTPVSVNSTDNSVLKQFIPDSIGQFLSDSNPQIIMDGIRADLLEQIRQLLVSLTSGVKFNEKTNQFDSNIQLVKLFEFDATLLKRIVNNLVVTSINFKEDVNTGFALYCDIVFEQVTFSTLKKVVIPQDVSNALKKKSANNSDKGKQDSTPNAGTPPKDSDPLAGVAAEL